MLEYDQPILQSSIHHPSSNIHHPPSTASRSSQPARLEASRSARIEDSSLSSRPTAGTVAYLAFWPASLPASLEASRSARIEDSSLSSRPTAGTVAYLALWPASLPASPPGSWSVASRAAVLHHPCVSGSMHQVQERSAAEAVACKCAAAGPCPAVSGVPDHS